MTWRLAGALVQLRAQLNEQFPTRRKDSDGSIGDVGHSARASDHNPNAAGVVCAIDITHDPASGCDSYALAEGLLKSKDHRIKYVISKGRIVSGTGQGQPAWKWRKYSGANPHNHHVHISVKPDKASYDSKTPWSFETPGKKSQEGKMVIPYVAPPATLRRGSKGEDVEDLQQILSVKVDGDFGPVTQEAVVAFQRSKKLIGDGVVGPMTWDALIKQGDVKATRR